MPCFEEHSNSAPLSTLPSSVRPEVPCAASAVARIVLCVAVARIVSCVLASHRQLYNFVTLANDGTALRSDPVCARPLNTAEADFGTFEQVSVTT
jgi:hypothetical protein